MIPCAANSTACWPDPHFRSMVTDGTWTGKPADSHACRPGVADCSPAWPTQPIMTSSTVPGSIPVRSTRAVRT